MFATKYEEPVGLLNKMAPRGGPLVDVNPEVLEVLETLDDAFEVEKVVKAGKLAAEDDDDDDDELDDILSEMVRAEKEESGADDLDDEDEYYDEEEEDGSSGSPYYYSENDEVPDLDERFLFDKEETKSKFTEYSMTSSVIKRSEQLSTLDDRFEAVGVNLLCLVLYYQSLFIVPLHNSFSTSTRMRTPAPSTWTRLLATNQ